MIFLLSVFLTDLVNTHFAIPYLNTDQCMIRPGQKVHGSYGLIFKRQYFYLCDELLICYPSQLVSNNTHTGIITSIPYRLREAKANNVTKQCEQRRKEFCENYQNYHLCSLGKPASTVWHGIKLKTEYITKVENKTHNNSVFVTTISLSITKQKYEIIDTVKLIIKFGSPKDIITNINLEGKILHKLLYYI
uniref:Uncharacterized protein n=1 Tax=Meloidogyne enterolobii TaxID=390850 RepID=A0A6V7UDY0_MELEN|nr:unnamed protein product [Meloidogyne enterolobii]